ncbi:MAG: E3 binding domain-containing protein [Proteobacteria bacterium]|nr:E3 binding domain-containing protein [Pseudomonadota bacterium]
MTTTFNLPDLGEGLQEAEIVEWKVKEGDTVAVDDPLVAVETDKVVVDVPSPYAGKITKLHWKNGDVVPTHSALVDFQVEGEAPAESKPAAKKAEAPKATAKPAAKKSGGKGTTFNLPDLGEGLQEAEIVEWKVKEGDTVGVDDPLVAVETDKAVVDVPSPYAGTILKLHWKNGDVVPTHSALVDFNVEGGAEEDNVAKDSTDTREKSAVQEVAMEEDSGTVVGKMATSDADLEETVVIRKKGRGNDNRRERGKASGATRTAARSAAPARTVVGTGRPKASPATRVYAKECGCDLTQIEGTGSKGQITKADVDAFMQSGGSQQQAQPAQFAGIEPGFGQWHIPAPSKDVE